VRVVNKTLNAKQSFVLEVASKVYEEVEPLLASHFPEFGTSFEVKANGRLKTAGGQAVQESYRSGKGDIGRLELNPNVLSDYPELIREVFIHELAHLVQFFYTGHTNHGSEFVETMTKLGCTPKNPTRIDASIPVESDPKIQELVRQYEQQLGVA
jgi:predicted SprT family Zn-dependent metalloprotease